MLIFFSIVSGAVASWLLLRALIPQLRRSLLDLPNARSSHRQPTPRGAGVAFVVVASASSGIALISQQGASAAALPLLAAPLALVGLLDDRHNLPATWRYGVQVLTAALMFGFSPLVIRFSFAHASDSLLLLPFGALLLIAVTGVINFTNFMDGLDGLVAGCMVVAICAVGIQLLTPWPLWALVGALLGFLLWNWSPAKVFMGDVGSTFLGAVFAGLVLQADRWPQALGLLLVATPVLGDACLCVLRRLLARQQVFQAHRLHLCQRLHQAGWCHAHVSSLYIFATAVLAIAHLVGGLIWVIGFAVSVVLIGVWLDQHVAVAFEVASKS